MVRLRLSLKAGTHVFADALDGDFRPCAGHQAAAGAAMMAHVYKRLVQPSSRHHTRLVRSVAARMLP